MRTTYLICYDVCEPKRLRRVHRIMLGAGDSMQYSVFRCELSLLERQQLLERLWEVLNLHEDRLLFANLGPSESRGETSLEYWGEPREPPEKTRQLIF